jgi:hypothetical protein
MLPTAFALHFCKALSGLPQKVVYHAQGIRIWQWVVPYGLDRLEAVTLKMWPEGLEAETPLCVESVIKKKQERGMIRTT